MMTLSNEQIVSRALRTVLTDLPNGASIPKSKQFLALLEGLEFFLPEVLRENHPEWREYESLDGFFPLVAKKTGDNKIEIFGLCILISDQTTTPIHLRLQVSSPSEVVSWLECKLGERGEHGMVRTKIQSVDATKQKLSALAGREDMIDWVYKVTFGHRCL